MVRTNISFTEEQYEWLREQSHLHRQSISQLVRELVKDTKVISSPKKYEVPKEVIEKKNISLCIHGFKKGLCKKGCK